MDPSTLTTHVPPPPPAPPLAQPPVAFTGTYFSLNTAVDPKAQVPGLMVATARALKMHGGAARSGEDGIDKATKVPYDAIQCQSHLVPL